METQTIASSNSSVQYVNQCHGIDKWSRVPIPSVDPNNIVEFEMREDKVCHCIPICIIQIDEKDEAETHDDLFGKKPFRDVAGNVYIMGRVCFDEDYVDVAPNERELYVVINNRTGNLNAVVTGIIGDPMDVMLIHSCTGTFGYDAYMNLAGLFELTMRKSLIHAGKIMAVTNDPAIRYYGSPNCSLGVTKSDAPFDYDEAKKALEEVYGKKAPEAEAEAP